MHGNVSNHVKMQRKPTGGTNKHSQLIIAWSEKGERYAQSNWHRGDASQMVTSKQGLVGVRCNYTTTNPLWVSNMAKPRTRETNTSVTHRNKQA